MTGSVPAAVLRGAQGRAPQDDGVSCCSKRKTPERIFICSGAFILRLVGLRRVEARDRLHLEIFFQTVFAPFAAVAGLLVAAERRGAVVRHALQVDVAGADLLADP